MRELFPVDEESTEEKLVLRTDDGERFTLSRALITAEAPQVPSPAESPTSEDEDSEQRPKKLQEESPRMQAARRSLPKPDPLYSTPITMRPREIQERIRAGASPQELADEMGVAVSRLDAYSHPVILERQQIAEAAKQSHPVREDGPAKLTLFEILATAFAARGHSLSKATWDALREPGDSWVVRVTWRAGLSEHVAEWAFKRHGFAVTTEARNAVAADLTDPNFVQPVRSLTAVNNPANEYDDEDDYYEDEEIAGDVAPTEEASENAPVTTPPAVDSFDQEQEEAKAPAPAPKEQDKDEEAVTEGEALEAPEDAPQRRKRKAVTPHWEDVLLGVRTNTKRPRK